MHLCDIARGGGAAGADRPDRLIGNNQLGLGAQLGDRAGELGRDSLDMAPRRALLLALADAHNRLQPGGKRGLGLGLDDGIALALVGAPLGMADDRQARAGFEQHRGRDIAGMGTGGICVAILRADGEAAGACDGEADQGERRANGDIHPSRLPRRRRHRAELRQRLAAAVHLPVSGNELAADVHRYSSQMGAGRVASGARGAKLARAGRPFYDRGNHIPDGQGSLLMLSIFRRGVTAKIMLGVLGLSLFAIVITGFGTGGMGGLGELGGLGASSIASVGGETISTQRVKEEADRQLAKLREKQPEADMARLLRGGSLEEIVDQLIGIAASVAFGSDNGLSVSRKMVDREIAAVPAFQNVAGEFDDAVFRQVLSREKLSEQQVRDEIRTRLIERQLVLPAAGSAHVPLGFATQYAALLLETRSGMVGAVPTTAMGVGSVPTDAELAAFYRSNIAGYTVPERRVIRYAAFGRENLGAAATATDAEIQAAYQRAGIYGAREVRTLSQVVLPSEAAARAFAAKLAAGTSFAQAAQQAGFGAADIAVGDQSREAFAGMTGPQVAAAAFSAAKGANVGPVRSGLGWHVVRVDNVKTVAATPLASVRAKLAGEIEQQKGQNALNEMASRIDGEIADGASFEQVVAKEKLQARETAPVTAAGAAPGVAGWAAPPELAPLLEGAFAMEAGDDPQVEAITPNQRFALVGVSRIVPPAAPPLAQIRDRVRADLIVQRASQRAKAVAQSIVSKINSGVAPAAAFAQAQVRLPAVQPLTASRRTVEQQGKQVPAPLAMLFQLPRGKARLLAAPGGRGWFIVYLDKIIPGDASKEPGLAEAVRAQFAQVIGDEYAQQFVGAIRAKVKIRRNDKAVGKLRAELIGAPASN
jgi:peptidyl-prolyl cis-trans isomerase D